MVMVIVVVLMVVVETPSYEHVEAGVNYDI